MLRQALMLRDVDQLPMPEVAGELGISLAAAKSRLLRGEHELKSRLDIVLRGLGTGGVDGMKFW